MKKVKIKFIEDYLTYKIGDSFLVAKSTAENLLILGVIEEVEKPKRGRKPKNKEELKSSIETK